MNDDKGNIIYCSRCGAEMKSTARYCMKCGNLNYDHKDNKDMQNFRPKEEGGVYQVGSGHSLRKAISSGKVSIHVSTNGAHEKTCFLVNYIVYLVTLVIVLLVSLHGDFTLDSFLKSSFPITAIIVTVFFLYSYSVQVLFSKCDKKWWYAFIPIYNNMVLGDICFHNQYIGLLVLIPGVGAIVSLVMLYQLGKKFQYSGLFTVLFPFIMILFISFGIHPYEGKVFVNSNEENSLEKIYQYRKIPLVTGLLVIVAGMGLFVFSDFDNFQKKMAFFGKGYYIYVAKQLKKSVEKNIEDSAKLNCEPNSYSENDGKYYFYYPDVRDAAFLLFYDFHEPMRGYVLVDNTDGQHQYYVSLTDETYGFDFTSLEDLDNDSVVEFDSSKMDDFSGMNECDIR